MSSMPPTRKFQPGERRIESDAKLKRMQADVKDRIGEHRLDGALEQRHGFLREEGIAATEAQTIRRMSRVAARSIPDTLSAADKRKWEDEGKKLGDWLSRHMITRRQASLKRTETSEFRKAANMMAENENSQEFARNAERWKNIQRQLHPEDPDAANLESIRPN